MSEDKGTEGRANSIVDSLADLYPLSENDRIAVKTFITEKLAEEFAEGYEQGEFIAAHPVYCPSCKSCGEEGCCPPCECDGSFRKGYANGYEDCYESVEHVMSKAFFVWLSQVCPENFNEANMKKANGMVDACGGKTNYILDVESKLRDFSKRIKELWEKAKQAPKQSRGQNHVGE